MALVYGNSTCTMSASRGSGSSACRPCKSLSCRERLCSCLDVLRSTGTSSLRRWSPVRGLTLKSTSSGGTTCVSCSRTRVRVQPTLWESRGKSMQQDAKYTLLELLEMFSYTKATVEVDRFFALLGLSDDGGEPLFSHDYDSQLQGVVRNYVRGFIKLDLIMDLSYRAGEGKPYFSSWIPCLTRGVFTRTISTRDANRGQFAAGRSVLPSAMIQDDNPGRLSGPRPHDRHGGADHCHAPHQWSVHHTTTSLVELPLRDSFLSEYSNSQHIFHITNCCDCRVRTRTQRGKNG